MNFQIVTLPPDLPHLPVILITCHANDQANADELKTLLESAGHSVDTSPINSAFIAGVRHAMPKDDQPGWIPPPDFLPGPAFLPGAPVGPPPPNVAWNKLRPDANPFPRPPVNPVYPGTIGTGIPPSQSKGYTKETRRPLIPDRINRAYRAALAVNMLSALRTVIQANGNFYDGGAAPNFTSVFHALLDSDQAILAEVRKLKDDKIFWPLIPTADEVRQIETDWSRQKL